MVVVIFLDCRAEGQTEGWEWKLEQAAVKEKTLKAVSGPTGELAQNAIWDDEEGLTLDGKQFIALPEKDARKLPKNALTVMARVKVNTPNTYGGLVSFSQDNGNYERGWILGFTGSRYSFKLSTGGKLITVTAPREFVPGQWVDLVATYDGDSIRLYLAGKQVSVGSAKGSIVLPKESTPFVLGAYKDKDEFFGTQGAISRVKILPRAMTAKEIRKEAGVTAGLEFTVSPHLRFVAIDEAELSWENATNGSAAVGFGEDKKLGEVATSSSNGRMHRVVLRNLKPKTHYYYRIAMEVGGKRVMGRLLEFETTMNYLPPVVEYKNQPRKKVADYLAAVRKLTEPDPTGYALVLGLTDGELALQLAKDTRLQVFAYDPDPKRVDAFRKKAHKLGIYGRRVTATYMTGGKLPLTGCLANLIVSERALAGETIPCPLSEVQRLLRPSGGVVAFPDNSAVSQWSKGSLVKKDGLLATRRGKLAGSTDWSHQYGNAGNTTNSGETMGGIKDAQELRLQWLGRPGADFNIDRQPRTSAPLAVNGRLYHQGMNRLIALDAYNGAVLWSMEVPDFRRLNVPHDSANWCADDDHLYMVVDEAAWVVDGSTGKVKEYLQIPTKQRDSHVWGFIATEGDLVFGSSVRSGSHFKDFWGSAMWFDKAGSSLATTQICSDAVFAYNKSDWKGQWSYGKGMIINSSISVANGKMFLFENREAKFKDHPTGQIVDKALWTNLWAVCLDVKTGRKVWDKKFPAFELVDEKKGYIQSAYGLTAHGDFLAVFSEPGRYVFHMLDGKNGSTKWKQKTPWRSNNHGAHIVHPVVMKDRIYVEPYGLNLKDGAILDHKVGPRNGCPTPAGWDGGLVFRGSSKQSGNGTIVLWDLESHQTTGWQRLRPSCWLNYLPTQGGLIVPEGGGGCSCGGWMETSAGFLPSKLTGKSK